MENRAVRPFCNLFEKFGKKRAIGEKVDLRDNSDRSEAYANMSMPTFGYSHHLHLLVFAGSEPSFPIM